MTIRLRRFVAHIREQNWTAVGIDFVMLVLGILLALQISEWNQARLDRAREHAFLGRISNELDQSIADLERGIRLAQQREAWGRLLMAAAKDEAPVRADPGEFVVALYTAAWTFSPPVRSHAFDELRSAGELGLVRDQSLLVAITEFYTRIARDAQWNYVRELRQTEYDRRVAGILDYAQILQVSAGQQDPPIPVEDALAARTRMLERPPFIEWLPTVADRYDEIDTYRLWLEQARSLRARIAAQLAAAGDA
jgi:hypothetical protein